MGTAVQSECAALLQEDALEVDYPAIDALLAAPGQTGQRAG